MKTAFSAAAVLLLVLATQAFADLASTIPLL